MTSDDIRDIYGIEDERSFNSAYLLLTIFKRVDKQNLFTKNVVVVDHRAQTHQQAWDNFHDQHWPKSAWNEGWRKTCPGGGYISFNSHAKSITIYGESGSYRKADYELTAGILRNHFSLCAIVIL